MPIPPFLLDRIKSSALSGPQITEAFIILAEAADLTGQDDCAINIEYADDSDALNPGDLIPTITLSLARKKTT